jgi:hypothetical protein
MSQPCAGWCPALDRTEQVVRSRPGLGKVRSCLGRQVGTLWGECEKGMHSRDDGDPHHRSGPVPVQLTCPDTVAPSTNCAIVQHEERCPPSSAGPVASAAARLSPRRPAGQAWIAVMWAYEAVIISAPMGRALSRAWKDRPSGRAIGWLACGGGGRDRRARRPGQRLGVGSHAPIRAPDMGSA